MAQQVAALMSICLAKSQAAAHNRVAPGSGSSEYISIIKKIGWNRKAGLIIISINGMYFHHLVTNLRKNFCLIIWQFIYHTCIYLEQVLRINFFIFCLFQGT